MTFGRMLNALMFTYFTKCKLAGLILSLKYLYLSNSSFLSFCVSFIVIIVWVISIWKSFCLCMINDSPLALESHSQQDLVGRPFLGCQVLPKSAKCERSFFFPQHANTLDSWIFEKHHTKTCSADNESFHYKRSIAKFDLGPKEVICLSVCSILIWDYLNDSKHQQSKRGNSIETNTDNKKQIQSPKNPQTLTRHSSASNFFCRRLSYM